MSCMSWLDSGVAMPSMIGFCRTPDLKSVSWRTMYSSLWPASFGYCASLELPSRPWQAPQTAALAWPAVASAAGAAACGWAIRAVADSANASATAAPRTAGRKPAERKLIHLTPERLANAADEAIEACGGQKPKNYPVPSYLGQTVPMPNPLQGAQFVLAAHRISQLPADHGAEVAFAGRSNAGKSSALNALTNHKGLARTSKTPGRTQQMVAFSLP